MLLMIVGNVLGALAIGEQRGLLGLAAGVGAGVAALAWLGTRFLRHALASSLLLATALGALVALQIHLSGGLLLYHFNVFITLSLLLAYRDWRPIAYMAGLYAVHHLAFDRLLQAGIGTYCLSQPDLGQIAQHIGFVVMQALVLSFVAIRQAQAEREAREIEVLINAMGREGPIRLNLDVIRAGTPAGQRLQHVQQRMAAAIREVHDACQQIELAAGQVAEGSHELLDRTGSTARELKESAVCLDQIGVIVQDSSEASAEAKAVSATATAMATEGDQLVTDMVNNMRQIESSSQRISDIITVIDGIAFQTNILALNAAVEAAHAGDHGRGFAVVASEVRSLAARSADAARQIKQLIGSSAETIHAGASLVSGAGKAMNQLVGSVKRVGELFEEVTGNTTDHMQGLQTVTQSITDLSTVTEQNLSVAERAGAASADLNELASRLSQVLSAFKLDADGSSVSAAGADSASTLAAPPSPAPARARPAPPPTPGARLEASPSSARPSRPAPAAAAAAEPASTVTFF
jgi:methyl-accepting chemotaxis protein